MAGGPLAGGCGAANGSDGGRDAGPARAAGTGATGSAARIGGAGSNPDAARAANGQDAEDGDFFSWWDRGAAPGQITNAGTPARAGASM